MINLEKPTEFSRLLLDFLDRLGRTISCRVAGP